jgi:3-deoxy-D-manno-octulosonic-acid transferase
MLRALYTLLVYAALPFLPLRLWWRGRREPLYREHVAERYGRYDGAAPVREPVLWIHAVSLGETRASVPLVSRVLAAFPAATVL